jgi:hypothetical protein
VILRRITGACLSTLTSTVMNRVAQIIQTESDADKLLAESDALRWHAAELIAAELADGKSQRQLAREIGKSQAHVSKCAKLWTLYGGDSLENRPAWHDVYRSVSGKSARRQGMTVWERWQDWKRRAETVEPFIGSGDRMTDLGVLYQRMKAAWELHVEATTIIVDMYREEGLPLSPWVRERLIEIANCDEHGFPL